VGKTFSGIDDTIRAFIERQHLFFVATAPAGSTGHVNCSPKGLDALRILDPQTVAYLDRTGSGAETIAHLRENGRIVLMFCAFEGAPNIVRLHGGGEVIEPGDPEFEALYGKFTPVRGARSVIPVRLDRDSDSCGYGVPLMKYESDRETLIKWTDRKSDEVLDAYQREKNAASIDGLPALRLGENPAPERD
jgi:hypothetical protein